MNISVIVPTYNRADTLPKALTSIQQQTVAVDEIIVVDDGSTDKTLEIVTKDFPQVKLISQDNSGVSCARNRGIRSSTSDWIAFLDSDDEWLPDKINQIKKEQSLHQDINLFHSDEIWIRNGVRVNPMKKHAKMGGDIFKNCLPLCVISPSASVLHKSLFSDIGLFNEALPACEDYDLWLRICHRYPVHYIDQLLIRKYGGHADQLSQKHWGMDRFRIRSLHSLMQLPTLSDQQKSLTTLMLIKKLKVVLKGAYKHLNSKLIDEFEPLLNHYENIEC